jgi:hypothetical protein
MMGVVAIKVRPLKSEHTYERVFYLNNGKDNNLKRADQYESFMIKRPINATSKAIK